MRKKITVPIPTDLVSVSQAAACADIHPGSIYRLIRLREITAYGRPPRLRVSLAAILPEYSTNVRERSNASKIKIPSLAKKTRQEDTTRCRTGKYDKYEQLRKSSTERQEGELKNAS